MAQSSTLETIQYNYTAAQEMKKKENDENRKTMPTPFLDENKNENIMK